MTELSLRVKGHCRCGEIQFCIIGAPLLTIACHCTNCQRMSASSYSLSALYNKDDFQLTKGEPVRGGEQTSAIHYHCPYCKSWLYNCPQQLTETINIRPTLLDNAQSYMPFIETFTEEKLLWVNVPIKHSFSEFPRPEEFLALMEAFSNQGCASVR